MVSQSWKYLPLLRILTIAEKLHCRISFVEKQLFEGHLLVEHLSIGAFMGLCGRGGGIWGKLWFSCGRAHYGKVLISTFQRFFASAKKIFWFGGKTGH